MKKKVRDMIEIIKADGWFLITQKGSHMHFKHPSKPGKVTVPYHRGSDMLDHFLVESILKQAGLK
jgi:predicted RNA binding protein YcfA (HicA-like mRNA interferase family)